MFSNQERPRPQWGHADAGHTIEAPRGRRWMYTLRKMPMVGLKSAATASARGAVIASSRLGEPFRFHGQGEQSRRSGQADMAVQGQLVRRERRIGWNAGQYAGAKDRRPIGRRTAPSLRKGVKCRLQGIDLIER